MSKTWLIYALGGGWGHLNRSLALARVVARSSKVKLISNSPYLSQVNLENCQIFAISPQASFNQTQKIIRQIIQHESYDCLIVDTFPRGLGGELQNLLAKIRQPKVFVNRYLKPEYIERYQLKEFVARNYDLVLIPGENIPSVFASLPQTVKTDPWLIRDRHELASLSTAADLLGLTIEQAQQHGQLTVLGRTRCRRFPPTFQPSVTPQHPCPPLIIILASGYQAELTLYGAIAHSLCQQGYRIRCLSATLPPACPSEIWRFHYPALECLWLADVVIGSGGYNTVFECAQLNLPLIAIPHQRLYDCQKTRITTQQQGKCWLAQNRSMAVKLTQQLLSEIKSHPLKPKSFQNGVKKAIKQIERCL
ncbi:MAG: glycosyltransferase [Cyanobacteria bacterium P01_G01_bin.39]